MSKNIFVVGIASSAGGLTPMQEIISEAVCHDSMAFILVPHLSRDYKSRLPEILGRVSELTIKVIENDLKIEPCHLYILPPGKYVKIEEDHLILIPRPSEDVNQSANILFKSLAASYGKNAIGIVLSGAMAGSDGSEGVRAIKMAGGKTFAQDPVTAEFPQMPELAIETGAIDEILEAREMGKALSKILWRI